MGQLTLPAEGGCRCDAVRFRITAPPLLTMACHCTGCRRMTASAYSLSAAIPTHGFELTKGEPVLGGLRGAPRHYHCGQCMSWLYTVMPGLDDFVNLRAAALDDPSWFTPYVETYTSEKLAFAETGAKHSYPQFPPMEDFGRLMQEYAALPA